MNTTTYRLVLPFAKGDKLINANHRHHWAVKARHTREWRNLALIIARRAFARRELDKLERARIEIFLHFGDKRSRDAHNYTLTGKAIVDGLVDAGLLPDDNNRHLIGPDMRAGTGKERHIEILIEPLPALVVA